MEQGAGSEKEQRSEVRRQRSCRVGKRRKASGVRSEGKKHGAIAKRIEQSVGNFGFGISESNGSRGAWFAQHSSTPTLHHSVGSFERE